MGLLDDLLTAWNRHDGTQMAALIHEDGIYEDVAISRTFDRHSLPGLVAETEALSSDYKMAWISTIQEGGRYAIEWEMSGTNDGPILALNAPATGRAWRVRGASLGLIDGGKIKRHSDYWNRSTLLQQLGLVPTPPP